MSDAGDRAYEHNLRGCRLSQEKDLARALREFDQAVALAPGAASYLSNRGLVKYRLGRRDDAIRDLEQAIGLDPHYPPARAILGDVLYASGRYTEALETYRAALDLGDKDAEGIERMMSKCRTALDELRGRSQVVIQRGPFRTRMSEKQFLGCLVVWAALIVVVYIVVSSTGITKGRKRTEGPVGVHADAMWRDAQRLVCEELSEADRISISFPQAPTYMPAEEQTRRLELSSVVEYTSPSHKYRRLRRSFRYEAHYTEDGALEGGRVWFVGEAVESP